MDAVFLYDGDCGICTRSARFIERHIPTAARVMPFQRADLVGLGVSPERAEQAVQWVVPGERVLEGPEAIAALLRTSRWYWRVIGRLPVKLTWPLYRWIARNRDKLPGGTAACAIPLRRQDA